MKSIRYLAALFLLLLAACGGPSPEGAIWDSGKWDQSNWQ